MFAGCSFTANSGFTVENQQKFHWPHLFCQQTNYCMENIAIGGMSNDEIFLRTVETVSTNVYDLVIIMWSQVGRHWVYESEKNIDDFTMINHGGITGFNASSDYTKQYTKLHYSHFNNSYVNIKRWLLQCTSLEKILKYNNTPYVFIKGFDNNITALNNAFYNDRFKGIDNIVSMFDFDNRSDDYILKKLCSLQRLISIQDQEHWLNLLGTEFHNMGTDFSDDHLHPGPIANQLLANNLINFTKKLNE